ncbi:hypothetical protein AbraIFM66950_011511 [Aspergillus brasiliensis]|nr:hypothetical protein AbraIFM66950_011511 [Aspergillus brasiliensis]
MTTTNKGADARKKNTDVGFSSSTRTDGGDAYAFTINVELAPAIDFGGTFSGDRRFIAITGGSIDGPRLTGKVLSGGGDWNAVRPDGVVDVFAKNSIQASDGTPISVTNEGFGRASQSSIKAIFDGDGASASDGGKTWYTKTWPRFEVALGGKWDWLTLLASSGAYNPQHQLTASSSKSTKLSEVAGAKSFGTSCRSSLGRMPASNCSLGT